MESELALASPVLNELEMSDVDWLCYKIRGIRTEHEVLSVSEFTERHRYLPSSVTSMPGYFSFSVTPYMREICDCFCAESPVREVALMKGVQIAATTIAENVILYYIAHARGVPIMLVSADADLVKNRMNVNIMPMLQHSGFAHLIKPSDEVNKRKTGTTERMVEFEGGGYLIPIGAKNPGKMRSASIQVLVADECDAFPPNLGKDGDPTRLLTDRTAGFEDTRKIFWLSTPLIKGQSNIESKFELGDQRRYYVRCLKCNAPQTIRFRRQNNETGQVSGLSWELESGRLVPGSVRYLCKECGHAHTNDDKVRLFDPNNGAAWVPTATPSYPGFRSYHIPALLSPPGMQSWEAQVRKWIDAWDVEHNRPKDNRRLQVFYNNVLGVPFELRGEKIRFEAVSAHRRDYLSCTVPNRFAEQHCGSHILLLTCAVDVHTDELHVAVFGWTRENRVFVIQYLKFPGRTDDLDCADTWGKLREFVTTRRYKCEDGKEYGLAITLIDSGFQADTVYRFCSEFESGVFPIKGRETPTATAQRREFSESSSELGQRFFLITVDFYKERWSAVLRRNWDGLGPQPHWHFNAPLDLTDAQLKELTVESRVERIRQETGERIGFEWRRPKSAPNELWDLLIYANAGLEMLAWDMTKDPKDKQKPTDWRAFWDICAEGCFYDG